MLALLKSYLIQHPTNDLINKKGLLNAIQSRINSGTDHDDINVGDLIKEFTVKTYDFGYTQMSIAADMPVYMNLFELGESEEEWEDFNAFQATGKLLSWKTLEEFNRKLPISHKNIHELAFLYEWAKRLSALNQETNLERKDNVKRALEMGAEQELQVSFTLKNKVLLHLEEGEEASGIQNKDVSKYINASQTLDNDVQKKLGLAQQLNTTNVFNDKVLIGNHNQTMQLGAQETAQSEENRLLNTTTDEMEELYKQALRAQGIYEGENEDE